MVRALACHLCAPGSIPRLGVISGFSLLFVLVLAMRGFLRGYFGFPISLNTLNNSIYKFQSDLDYCQALYHETLAWEIVQTYQMCSIKALRL